MSKLCRACGETKPASDFYKDASKADGLNAYCKPCQKARVSAFSNRPGRHDAKDGMKRCQTCREVRPVADFSANRKRADGLNVRCRECNATMHKAWLAKYPGKNAAYAAAWRAENPARARDHQRKTMYGLPLGTYDKILAEQGGRCAICGTDTPGGRGHFHVDHCHDSGKFRGLLCHHCNIGIGNLRHDTDILEKASAYLQSRRQT